MSTLNKLVTLKQEKKTERILFCSAKDKRMNAFVIFFDTVNSHLQNYADYSRFANAFNIVREFSTL